MKRPPTPGCMSLTGIMRAGPMHMLPITASITSTALLEGLYDAANHEIWREFDCRFRPVLVSFGRRLGLHAQDAADLAQETLLQFVRDYRAGKYDRSRGRLGAWLMGIARHRLQDARRAKLARREVRGESAIVTISDDSDLEAAWDAECRQAILEEALRELAESSRVTRQTWAAFRLHVVEQIPVEEVARRLGTTIKAVYLAKHRYLRRLREAVEVMNERYGLA